MAAKINQRKFIFKKILPLIFTVFFVNSLYAFDIEMTDTEWATWPEYCKTRYSELGAVKNPRFLKFYSPQLADKWKKILGNKNYAAVQHYCTGKIWLHRAKKESGKKQRAWDYDRSIAEFLFMYDRAMYSFPFFSNLSAYLAQAYYEIGNRDKAISVLENTIKIVPKGSPAYAELANIYRKEGKLDESLSVLKTGLKNVGENSVNIQLYLAHVYIDKNDYEKAEYHANKTYKLGYPLPGLKKKLQTIKANKEDLVE